MKNYSNTIYESPAAKAWPTLETGLHFHTFRSNAYTHVFTIQSFRFAIARILDQSKNTAVFQSTLQSEGEDVVSERLTTRI